MKKQAPKKGKYVKANTPEARKRQRAAIVGYYVKKKGEEAQKKPWWLS